MISYNQHHLIPKYSHSPAKVPAWFSESRLNNRLRSLQVNLPSNGYQPLEMT